MLATAPLTSYRIQVTATRGEQLVVERQYQASRDKWVTTGKYLTANIAVLPKHHSDWMEMVPAMFADSKLPRCLICGWPLADRVEDGCVPGNCSYRPVEGTVEYERIQKRRAELRAGWDQLDGAIMCDQPVTEEIDPETILPSEY